MKEKEIRFYMGVAHNAAQMSYAKRKKVGAVIVTANGGMYYGYNGTLPGFDNECEDGVIVDGVLTLVTKPNVIHAEMNCLAKMLKEGVSTKDSTLFLTLSPCINCAMPIAAAGIKHVYYSEKYRDSSGIIELNKANVGVDQYYYVERTN